jgi:hypothetical protein
MLTATTRFTPAVGIAPSTSTIKLDGGGGNLGVQCLPVPTAAERLAAPPPPPLPKVEQPVRHFYTPYANGVEMKSAGALGLIDPNDAWWTGRQYGLPTTTALQISKREDGSYDGTLIGADLGADDALVQVLQEQQKSLKRIAFWTAVMGGVTAGVVAVAVIGSIGAAGGMTRKREG